MEKHIIIQGTNNKYEMKKLKKEEKIIKKRKSSQDYAKEYFNIDDQLKYLSEVPCEVTCQISQKLSSYKQQDLRKNIFAVDEFITFDLCILKLKECLLSCYYCKNKLFVLYSDVREKMQWTLDRIDNKIGHNTDNVVISCLGCNLKRRNCNKDAFLFTKQLTIHKL
jgi:hypothetical protein